MTPEHQNEVIEQIFSGKQGPEYVIHRRCYGPFGYYRENARGYTDLEHAWRVPLEVAQGYQGGREDDSDRVRAVRAPVRDFYGDLNEMARAERSLDEASWDDYVRWIEKVAAPGRSLSNIQAEWVVATASSAQRAEAFLRVHNAWEE